MIPVRVGGTELMIVPKRLLNYVEKCDYIKSRRCRPWDLLKGIPRSISANDFQSFVEVAMATVYASSSFVSFEEELQFDKSQEGFLYQLWRGIEAGRQKQTGKRRSKLLGETQSEMDPLTGIQEAKLLWDSASDDEKDALIRAINATDEAAGIKKSSGPSKSSDQPAPEP